MRFFHLQHKKNTRRPWYFLGGVMASILIFTALFSVLPNVTTMAIAAQVKGQGKPNTYTSQNGNAPRKLPPNPHPDYGSVTKQAATQSHGQHYQPIMKPLDLPLTTASTSQQPASQHMHGLSSDGILEVDVPANAMSAATISQAGGSPHLIVTQVDPPSGSTNGGIISFGTYLFQIQDGHGKEVASGAGLGQAITVKYHWKSRYAPIPLGIQPVVFILNGTQPSGLASSVKHLGKNQSLKTQYDAQANTLTAIVPLPSSSSTGGLSTVSPEGYFGKQDFFENNAQTGDVTQSVPIDVSGGPGGLTPPISLTYNSAAVNDTHNVQAAAPWTGEGWNLDLGQITWSEAYDANLNNNTTPASNSWRSSWTISDPFGTNGDLIPPSWNVASYYDDTNYAVATTPLTWHTAPEDRAKIISFPNPNSAANGIQTYFPPWNGSTGYKSQPPCWRVWLPNGIMEEFGCTKDSLQWYPAGSSGTTNYVAAWRLDLITDPNGNQVHVQYDQDMQTAPSGNQYPRDEVLKSITWDSPGCHDPNTACASWNPLMQVSFQHDNSAHHPVNNDSGQVCGPIPNTNGLRCDDPDTKGNCINGTNCIDIGTPLLTQTQILNDVQVQVRSSGSGSWNLVRNYQLSYQQNYLNPNRINDPWVDNTTISPAGYLLLRQVLETGTDGTAYPAQSFNYQSNTKYYEDSNYTPAAGASCGPAWNKSCILLDRSYSAFYLSEADNGLGAQQTFQWEELHTNQHGGAPSSDWTDPTSCNSVQSQGANTPFPCDRPDDNGWSRYGLSSKTIVQNSPTSANNSAQTTGTWYYGYHLSNLTAQECNNCQVGMYWGNANSADRLDYYNGRFMGFVFSQVERPDGVTTDNTYYATEGWGVWNTSQVACKPTSGLVCQNDPYWDLTNAAHGHPTQIDIVNVQDPQTGKYPLMQRTVMSYANPICPASGVGSTGSNGLFSWSSNLVAEVDQDNPIASCDIRLANQTVYDAEGVENAPSYGAISSVPMQQTAYQFDQNETNPKYSHLTATTATGNDLGTTPTIVHYTMYVWNDAVQTSSLPPTGTYIVDRPAFTDIEDGAGHQQQCSYDFYDSIGQAGTGQQSGLTHGLTTRQDSYTACGGSGTVVTTTDAYNANGDPSSSLDADANAGISGHTAPSGSLCVGATGCATYDATYGVLPSQTGNALGQTTATTTYNAAQSYGYGLWPQSVTDVNGQISSMTYDGLGRTVSATLPLEGNGLTTTTTTYSNTCPATGPSQPCLEVDATQRLDSTHTTKSAAFYDGWGHLVETRKPGPVAPGGQEVVQYMMYDNQGRQAFASVPYYVSTGTGYAIPDTTQPGTSTTYDALGRVTISTDATSATTRTSYAVATNVTGSDSAPYTASTVTDANSHRYANYADALGRTIYSQEFTGNSTYTLYRTLKTSYSYLGQPTSISYADGVHSAQATYNALGEEMSVADPDLGSMQYTYDPNGNTTSSQDARGTSGTVYQGFDGVNRIAWSSINSNGSSPLASYSYDSTANGNSGVGQLTSENFASGPSQSITGSYTYTYDGRGRLTQKVMTIAGMSKTFTVGYNDADQQTGLGHDNGTTLTTSFDANGWFTGAAAGSTTVLNNVYYANLAGAAGEITNAGLGNNTALVNWFDYNLRQTKEILSQNSTTLFEEDRTFDQVGNVATKTTTVPQGTVYQTFCYDEMNRLIWAGSSGTPTCSTALPSGTFSSAQYHQSYSYDTENRLTNGLVGAATFGDGSSTKPLHAVLSSSNGYTATYDAAGEMLCRAPTSSQSCSAAPQTGQQMGYDALNRLISWQNQPTSPTSTAQNAYDGSGERVWQQTTSGGTTTTTRYFGGLEETATTGGTTITTRYYAAGGVTLEDRNGTFSYLLNDGLGSVSVAMSTTGSITADALFKPYGGNLYHSNTMPTSLSFTGQYADNTTGLDYYGARYYDPTSGQFTTADTAQGPNRFGYVSDNPETLTDPTGHWGIGPWCLFLCSSGGDGGAAAGVSAGALAVTGLETGGEVLLGLTAPELFIGAGLVIGLGFAIGWAWNKLTSHPAATHAATSSGGGSGAAAASAASAAAHGAGAAGVVAALLAGVSAALHAATLHPPVTQNIPAYVPAPGAASYPTPLSGASTATYPTVLPSATAINTGAGLALPNTFQLSTYDVAQEVANQTGGLITQADSPGWKVAIPKGKRTILVRVMEAGAGISTNPYYRVSIAGKQAYTREGAKSNNQALTHIDLTDRSVEEILNIVSIALGD